MVKRVTELENFLKTIYALLDLHSLKIPCLTVTEWTILKYLCNVLKPFERSTNILSCKNYPTASIIIVIVHAFLNICDLSKIQNFSDEILTVIDEIEKGIKHFKNIERSVTLRICTFLDPKFKHAGFSDDAFENIKSEIQSKLIAIEKGKEKNNLSAENPEPLETVLGESEATE
ncbi:hypothetical protein PGB90_009728 [Kerria lacca]